MSFRELANKEYIIETSGSNLDKVLKLDIIDFTKTITNDPNEINSILGIEAGRQSLINEIRIVF